MEKAITKIIFGLILVSGVFGLWILRGRPSSFKSEFNKTNSARNAFVFVILLAAAIATIIYINNR